MASLVGRGKVGIQLLLALGAVYVPPARGSAIDADYTVGVDPRKPPLDFPLWYHLNPLRREAPGSGPGAYLPVLCGRCGV